MTTGLPEVVYIFGFGVTVTFQLAPPFRLLTTASTIVGTEEFTDTDKVSSGSTSETVKFLVKGELSSKIS